MVVFVFGASGEGRDECLFGRRKNGLPLGRNKAVAYLVVYDVTYPPRNIESL